jgi:hypothetical protein
MPTVCRPAATLPLLPPLHPPATALLQSSDTGGRLTILPSAASSGDTSPSLPALVWCPCKGSRQVKRARPSHPMSIAACTVPTAAVWQPAISHELLLDSRWELRALDGLRNPDTGRVQVCSCSRGSSCHSCCGCQAATAAPEPKRNTYHEVLHMRCYRPARPCACACSRRAWQAVSGTGRRSEGGRVSFDSGAALM